MKSLLHRAVRPVRHWRGKKTLSEEVRGAYKTLLITVLILTVGTGMTYLYVNSLKPAKGYLLKELQSDYNDLETVQRKLNQEVIEAESFIHIQNSDALKQMESVEKSSTAYVDPSPVADAGTNHRAD